MADHFACIGFDHKEAILAGLEAAVGSATARERPDGGFNIVWRDTGGASIVVRATAAKDIECATPSFAGRARVAVRATSIAEDPECRFCSRLLCEVVDERGEALYPLALEVEEMGLPAAENTVGAQTDIRASVFAEEVTVWPDEAAYDAARVDPPLASRSLIPVGLFTADAPKRRGLLRRRDRSPTAHAIVTGVVTEAGTRTNSLTSTPFQWACVDTYGASLDLVAATADAPQGFEAGNVVQVQGWLVGRLSDAKGE